MGEVWVGGVDVDWGGVSGAAGGVVSGLPSYAFQRERFWLGSGVGVGGVAAAGLSAAGHPLLGAAVGLGWWRGVLFTGRLSLESHPWLADHVVLGVVLLPGAGFWSWRCTLGAQAGCPAVRGVDLGAPLVFREGVGVQLQVSVGRLGTRASGRWAFIRVARVPRLAGRERSGCSLRQWCAFAAQRTAQGTSPVTGGRGAVDTLAAEFAGWPPLVRRLLSSTMALRAFGGRGV